MVAPLTLSRPLAARIAALPDVIDHADNPPVSQPVIEASIAALNAGKTHYTDRPGILGLRAWVSKHLQERFGLELNPDEVTITCGSTEARFVALKLLMKHGQEIICPSGMAEVTAIAQLIGVSAVGQVGDPKAAALLYLTPGDPIDTVQSLLDQSSEHGWWIVWDVSLDSGDFHPAQDRAFAPKVVTIGSLSQAMPGWRLGWMAGSEMANKLRAFKQSISICTTSISQWAGLGLVEK